LTPVLEMIDEIGVHRGSYELAGEPDNTMCLPVCDCGWRDVRWFGADDAGRSAARERWARHALLENELRPPDWLVTKAEILREQITELIRTSPPAALTLLADIDGWHGALLRDAVAAARATGASWADIGEKLGMSRQAAHERFRGVA
jgi:hypothetical protein